MTDLATKPDDTVAPAASPTDDYAWAPAEPDQTAPRHRARWIAGYVAAGTGVIALVAASLVLIAPGTSASGVDVGWMTRDAAVGAVQSRLDATTVTIAGETVGARDLGMTVDAASAADASLGEHPLWNPTTWFQDASAAQIVIDADVANAALQGIVPDLYVAPTDAGLAFDAASSSYVVTPAVDGQAVDLGALRLAVQRAFDAGVTEVATDAVAVPVAADVDSAAATAEAASLNGMLASAGFYIGAERTVPIDAATAASWLTIAADDQTGAFVVTADEAKIQAMVDTLPGLVDRGVVNATVITNSAGEALSEVTPGANGRQLGDTSDVAADFAAQLATGNSSFVLPVTEVAFTTTNLYRNIVVDIGDQMTYLYENNQLVASYAVSTGLVGTDTPYGDFTVFAHVRIQDMGCVDGYSYCTKDVPWVTYFAENVGFHGAYWHNNFGNRMSHGCVNMPIDVAQFVYNWAPDGTEVSVV